MVGIFKGDIPLGMGDNLSEVYVGAVRVWPTDLLYGRGAAFSFPPFGSADVPLFTPDANVTVGLVDVDKIENNAATATRIGSNLYVNQLPGYVAGKRTEIRLHMGDYFNVAAMRLEYYDNNGTDATGNRLDRLDGIAANATSAIFALDSSPALLRLHIVSAANQAAGDYARYSGIEVYQYE